MESTPNDNLQQKRWVAVDLNKNYAQVFPSEYEAKTWVVRKILMDFGFLDDSLDKAIEQVNTIMMTHDNMKLWCAVVLFLEERWPQLDQQFIEDVAYQQYDCFYGETPSGDTPVYAVCEEGTIGVVIEVNGGDRVVWLNPWNVGEDHSKDVMEKFETVTHGPDEIIQSLRAL